MLGYAKSTIFMVRTGVFVMPIILVGIFFLLRLAVVIILIGFDVHLTYNIIIITIIANLRLIAFSGDEIKSN